MHDRLLVPKLLLFQVVPLQLGWLSNRSKNLLPEAVLLATALLMLRPDILNPPSSLSLTVLPWILLLEEL